jgi:hypothetical protein
MKQDESTYSAVQQRFKFNSLYEKNTNNMYQK